jgi:hypothetical protein
VRSPISSTSTLLPNWCEDLRDRIIIRGIDTNSPLPPIWVLVVETYPTLREPLRGTGTARLTPSFANAEPPERLYKVGVGCRKRGEQTQNPCN